MNQQEQLFINSIKSKISKYKINISVKDCLKHAKNKFLNTRYNDGTTELVDIGIEYFICKSSPAYFIERYCFITIPGKGKEPAKLYYFQKEILRSIGIY